jgi:hypothetical protein
MGAETSAAPHFRSHPARHFVRLDRLVGIQARTGLLVPLSLWQTFVVTRPRGETGEPRAFSPSRTT